ncbi:MAG: hypothetical protein ACKOCX_10270, partial [Planctomycetota bacterium]
TLVTLLALCLPVAFEAAARGQEAATPPTAGLPPEPSTAAAVPDPAPMPAPGPAPVVSELSPELYYLQDESGRLVPVPGFRYRDFLEMFRIKEGLGGPAAPPAAIIESAVVAIDARALAAGTASCPVQVTLRVRQSRGGWAMVPLGLGQVLLAGPPQHDGPGRMLVDADPDGGGYRAWFEPPRDAGDDLQHVVTLAGSLPVVAGESRESFALRMPVAVASRVELRTDKDEPRVELRPPAAGRVETAAADGGRLVIVTGLAGDVGIRLEEAGSLPAAERATEADCQSVVRIDGRTALISAELALTNLAPGMRQLRITLPKQARLRRVGGDGALVDATTAARDETVTVAVEPAGDGSAMLELECERPVDPNGTAAVDPLGFAVADVEPWLQRGRMSLFIDGEWQVTWEDMAGIRRVDAPATEREPGLVAAFAYDAQPASLPLVIRPRRSRVVVEPEYRYDVATSRVALEARLRVAVRGAPVGGISLALDPAWILGDVGPAGVVDAAGVRSEGGRITIPFLQPLAGDAVVEIDAALEVDPDADRLAWRLPAPKADLVGPAAVVVSSATDIELLPDSAGISGLVRQTSSSLPATDAAIALAYRLDAPEGSFAATRRFLPRRIEAVLTGRIAADERQIEVAETIRLDVLHVPLEFLELSMAQEVLDTGTLEIRQGTELLEALDIVATTETDSVGRPLVLVRALLPKPLLGRGEVTVAYRLPTPAIPAEATAAVDLPLPVPVASGAIRQSVAIEESQSLTIMPRGESWRRDVSGQPSAGRTWSTSQPRQVLPLAISARTREAVGVTVIEAAWLRTRLFPDTREDTATYVVVPAEPQLELQLPVAAAASVEARLDGSPVSVQARGEGRIAIDMTPPGPGGRLLEIRTTAPWGGTFAGLGLPWPLPLDPPAFDPDVLQRRFSWEVAVLPGDHLCGVPARWTGQQRWAWQGFGWTREATVSSGELADWVAQTLGRPAVTVAAPAWAPEAHRSVYAGIGAPGTAAAWVVPTWAVVLVASGLALAVGLGMVEKPAWRSPRAVLGMLACGTLLAAALPDTVPLAAQAAAPGVALAALAAGLTWFGRPTRRRRSPPVSGPASSLTRAASPTVSLIVGSSVERGSQVVGRDAS